MEWKESHKCKQNYFGSSGGMEPEGAMTMFKRSLEDNIRYKYLISDGDSKAHPLILQEQLYGMNCMVEKKDCIGLVHKRMGNALRELRKSWTKHKLSDGKGIGGKGRLTEKLWDTLQNYYGNAIRRNVPDVDAMMKAVQATLRHVNSTDEASRHNLCPTGEDSWCSY